jgi:TonB family protein
LGWETVAVPAGSFHALHVKEAAGDVWLLDSIPFGFVKVATEQGELVLTTHGTDAKSSLAEESVRTPPWLSDLAASAESAGETVRLDSAQQAQLVKTLCDQIVHHNLIRSDSEPHLPPAVWSSLWSLGVLSRVDEPPRLLPDRHPKYPKEMASYGFSGRVVIRGIVDTMGRVERGSIVVVSEPYSGLGFTTRQFVERAHFAPGRVCGRPVRVLVEIPFDYKLRPR